VRKLYDAGIVGVDKGKQCGARRQHCVHRIFQAPTFPKFRNWSCLEIKCEELRQFVDAEWPGSHGDTLKQSVGKFRVCLLDPPQGAFIRFVESIWQFGQGMTDTSRMTAAKVDNLTIYPTEPTSWV